MSLEHHKLPEPDAEAFDAWARKHDRREAYVYFLTAFLVYVALSGVVHLLPVPNTWLAQGVALLTQVVATCYLAVLNRRRYAAIVLTELGKAIAIATTTEIVKMHDLHCPVHGTEPDHDSTEETH